jgi:hypothetical protein
MDNTDVTIESEAQAFAAWIADESIKMAEKFAYKDENGNWIKDIQRTPRVSVQYMKTRFDIMKGILIKAGYRLARLLETIVEYSLGKEADEALSIIPTTEGPIGNEADEVPVPIIREEKPVSNLKSFGGQPLSDKTNLAPQVLHMVPNNYNGGMMEQENDESTITFQPVPRVVFDHDESTRRGDD